MAGDLLFLISVFVHVFICWFFPFVLCLLLEKYMFLFVDFICAGDIYLSINTTNGNIN